MSILDLIDGAVEQHGDAMRWSPNPQDKRKPEPLTPEQEAELLRHQMDELVSRLRSVHAVISDEFGRQMRDLLRAARPALEQLAALESEQRRYVYRIHTAYRHRSRRSSRG
jgi:hypothetical protein